MNSLEWNGPRDGTEYRGRTIFWRYLTKLFYAILSGLRPGEQGEMSFLIFPPLQSESCFTFHAHCCTHCVHSATPSITFYLCLFVLSSYRNKTTRISVCGVAGGMPCVWSSYAEHRRFHHRRLAAPSYPQYRGNRFVCPRNSIRITRPLRFACAVV